MKDESEGPWDDLGIVRPVLLPVVVFGIILGAAIVVHAVAR